MSGNKYVPPYRRNKEFNKPKPHRDLSHVAGFNVLSEDDRPQKPKQLQPVKKVEQIVEPIIIPPLICNNQSPYQDAVKAGLEFKMDQPLVDIKENNINVNNTHKLGPSKEEIELFQQLAISRRKFARRKANQEYNDWIDEHRYELEDMYTNIVDRKLGISFAQFVDAAYACSI